MFDTWELMALDYEERKDKLISFIKANPTASEGTYYAMALECGFDYGELEHIMKEV